ncbi:MAG: glycosyltransferase family 39 protein [Flavobacteriales bacterium]|nr:glycosyltransferase family 39 protein [Flavobacteriales bacterium]MEB2342457.1 glycosyltransferase family 39 protein [Flavobacteriia bacterium]
MPAGPRRRRRKDHQPGWKGFRADLADGWKHVLTHTSTNHKVFVLFVLLLGTVLRILRLGGPVTMDEALTYVNYAGRPFGFLLSDYTYASNHILYAVLGRASTLLLGVHPWSLRLPALLAGILAMGLGYLFVRKAFNRHIAVIYLCLLAVSGPLVEYSAMARGFSLVWLFTLGALLASRHFVKTENWASAIAMALACALGAWAAPAMAYPALMVYGWTLFMIMSEYESTVRRRALKLAGSFLLALLMTALCYTPVVVVHSLDQLIHHPSLVDNTWAKFANSHQDRTFDLWAYFTATTSATLAFAGIVAVSYAAYVSKKYRLLLWAMLLAALALVLLMHQIPPPAAWTYILLVFHLGTAIGLFYLLKFVRDKFIPAFSKGQRTLVAGVLVLLAFGWMGQRGDRDPVERFPDAQLAAEWVVRNTRAGDRVCVQAPWDVPLKFYLACAGGDVAVLMEMPAPGGKVWALVAPGHGQVPEGVLLDAGLPASDAAMLKEIKSWGRLELYGSE